MTYMRRLSNMPPGCSPIRTRNLSFTICTGVRAFIINRGTCPNSVTVRKDSIEEQLLDELQSKVLQPDAIGYVMDQFGNNVRSAFANLSDQLAQMRERKQQLKGELRRLAAAETGPSAFLVEAIHEREQPLREITDPLLAQGDDSVEGHLADIRNFITERTGNLPVRCWPAIRCLPGRNCSSMFRRSA